MLDDNPKPSNENVEKLCVCQQCWEYDIHDDEEYDAYIEQNNYSKDIMKNVEITSEYNSYFKKMTFKFNFDYGHKYTHTFPIKCKNKSCQKGIWNFKKRNIYYGYENFYSIYEDICKSDNGKYYHAEFQYCYDCYDEQQCVLSSCKECDKTMDYHFLTDIKVRHQETDCDSSDSYYDEEKYQTKMVCLVCANRYYKYIDLDKPQCNYYLGNINPYDKMEKSAKIIQRKWREYRWSPNCKTIKTFIEQKSREYEMKQ